jgi:uncharacterized protein (TIGR02147 family)
MSNPTRNMNIFQHTDARVYLRETWLALKEENSKYSARFISKQMGYSNPVYFLRVISGERKLSTSIVDSLIQIFKLVGDEAEYFRYLCFYSEETDIKLKEDHFDRLISLNHTPQKRLLESEYRFHKDWYHNTIWATLDVIAFKGEPEEYQLLGSKIFPRLPAQKVKESIQLLIDLNYIAKDKTGHWRPQGKTLIAKARLHDEIVMHYWLKTLTLASQTILGKPKMPPKIYTNTFSCSAQAHARIHRKLDKLGSDIRAIVNKDDQPSERVLHFQFQMFDQFQEND